MTGMVTWCPLVLVVLLFLHPAASSPQVQRPRGDATLDPRCRGVKCEDTSRPVCGNNNIVYRNACYLFLADCATGRTGTIIKANDGPCVRRPPTPTRRPTPRPSPCKAECTKIYTPLCGSDGKTYNNLCILKYENCTRYQVDPNAAPITVVREGKCGDSCFTTCRNSYEPVCSTNGQTYHNECELSVANCLDDRVRQRYVGVCDTPSGSSGSNRGPASAGLRPSLDLQPTPAAAPAAPHASVVNNPCDKPCSLGFRPVCGNDGVTYGSDCLLQRANCRNSAIQKRADGVCLKDCSLVCPEDDEPVCGNDNKNYSNSCFLYLARCKDPSIRKHSDGRCPAGVVTRAECTAQVKCNLVYEPVCGSDGATYSNLCHLGKASCLHKGLIRFHDGECRHQ